MYLCDMIITLSHFIKILLKIEVVWNDPDDVKKQNQMASQVTNHMNLTCDYM